MSSRVYSIDITKNKGGLFPRVFLSMTHSRHRFSENSKGRLRDFGECSNQRWKLLSLPDHVELPYFCYS